MYFTLVDILLVFGFGALCLYFLAATRVRELAVKAVARAGEHDDYQLLDQSVQISRISLSRDRQGRWRIWRQYRFDYTFDGVERRQGHVIMLGKDLQAVVENAAAACNVISEAWCQKHNSEAMEDLIKNQGVIGGLYRIRKGSPTVLRPAAPVNDLSRSAFAFTVLLRVSPLNLRTATFLARTGISLALGSFGSGEFSEV